MNKAVTIRNIAMEYEIVAEDVSEVIDSSHGEDDIRLVYIINKQYVLHCYSSNIISEKFLQEINRLVKRHKDIGVWAPGLITVKGTSNFLCECEEDSKVYHCYMEELAPFSFIDESKVDIYQAKENMLPFLGKLACKYSNFDLSETHSMWSIIDLSPFDVDIDEKQENINILCDALNDKALSKRIRFLNDRARNHIKKYYNLLPRCVFQGDLNPSNILIDDNNDFKGIIDFNMFGTDVNINCFLNESMYYIEDKDFSLYSSSELLERMNDIQSKLMSRILEYYILNEVELATYEDYRFIINIGFYPNVMLMVKLLQEDAEKVLEFLTLICNQYS